jgi:hypothetical protein
MLAADLLIKLVREHGERFDRVLLVQEDICPRNKILYTFLDQAKRALRIHCSRLWYEHNLDLLREYVFTASDTI